MISPTNIHPPKNWQDFETLCLKLWGEIWEIPHEIEFNSDNAQGQQGVDIYGAVDDGAKYNGIQCKNKKLNLIDGSPNRITTSDIQAEIDKALHFQPKLNKLVIATSLPKDQKIEEYVRIKSVENVTNKLFSIQICFWDFFERKIPEFPKVNDWYLKHENHYRQSGISITFADGSTTLEVNPKFKKIITKKVYSSEAFTLNTIREQRPAILKGPLYTQFFDRTGDWEQYCWFDLKVRNIGKKTIEDYKIELEFEGEFETVGTEESTVLNFKTFKSNVKAYSNCNRSLLIDPYNSVLVSSDGFTTRGIYVKPTMGKIGEVLLKWKLLSRDFEDEGQLVISIIPKYNIERTETFVEDEHEEGETFEISLIQRKLDPGLFGGFSDDVSDMEFE